ncbi:putative Zn-dependent peptidase [Xenococcus sp. PCC 7305]|uniref:M16 family metallopeptidase n=1 Tax=Xenococcus sp. PCC 7305 TaxID=102125 RepID=UPI0002ACA050|nr:pitrilysin family protein [Xenococcus sp. PCC 7305]ELS02061.1 putative Zn-dependent peptidase [Xenococcus sp. PCC 7305]
MVQLLPSPELAELPAKIFTLDNGLTLIHQHLPVTPVVVADVWVRAGASAEPESWSGIAHFLEHMIFKGSPEVAVGEFDWVIENTGGIANAATSHDYAHFYLTTANSHIAETLPYLANILLQASIPDEEFIRERDVVLEEIRSSYDDPDWLGFQTLCQTLYQSHVYKRSILGDVDLLMQHTPDLMRCFHRTHYQPENMTLVLVGGIEAESAVSMANQAFSQFSLRSECPRSPIEAEPPLIGVRRHELQLPRIEQARLLMGWIGPGIEDLEVGVGLDMLSVILAGGQCSRLVQELREEKQLVLDICGQFSLQKDSSLFTITAWLEPQYLDRVEKIICDRVWQLANEPLLEVELARTKRLLLNDYIFSTETPGQLAGIYGYYNTIATLDQCTSYPAVIKKITAEKLQQVADLYLSPERYASVILKPC